MFDFLERTLPLVGEGIIGKFERAHVALFGLGGVGGYVGEALVRGGIGELTVFDGDVISLSNVNRQIIATHSNVGEKKCEAFAKRALEINPQLKLHLNNVYFTEDNSAKYDFSQFSYVIDAVDMVSAKVEIIRRAKAAGKPIISSMGAGNKIYTNFIIDDISRTTVCPLARVMRAKLKAEKIENVKCVFTTEMSLSVQAVLTDGEISKCNTRHSPASISFVPGVAGLVLAGEVLRDIGMTRDYFSKE